MNDFGKIFIIIGILFLVFGILVNFFGFSNIPRLPGDIYVKRDNFTFYFPIVTSIVLSIVFTIIINLFFRK